jgi:HK97 family phage major capsid protein
MNRKEIQDRMQTALVAAKGICDVAEGESRDFSAEERQKVEGYLKEAKELKAKLKDADSDDALRKELLALGVGLADPKVGLSDMLPAGRGKTLGEQFVGSDAFKGWMKSVAPSGNIPEGARGLISPPVEFKTLLTGESVTSAGAFVQTDYTGIYEPLGRRPLTIRDLISVRQTQSDLVEFVRQTAKVTQATVVGEANVTTYASGQGEVSGSKPEGAMTFEKVQQPVKTIAVWIPATKRALSDVAQLRSLIDAELTDDLEEHLEDQIIGGNGSSTDGADFVGIENTTGVQTQAWATDILTTTRQAVTALRVTGRTRPTAWAMHPNDAETIDLLEDTTGRYYFGGPAEGGVQRLWRYPVIESEAVTEGQAILGDWRKAVLWDREQASIQVSDSHSDFFIRNMVAVLAEMRAAFGVIRPSAFILVALSAS